MKNEKLIVAAMIVLLVALSVAAAFAARVAPKGNMQYSPYPGKPGRVESKFEQTVPLQAVPITEPTSEPLAQ